MEKLITPKPQTGQKSHFSTPLHKSQLFKTMPITPLSQTQQILPSQSKYSRLFIQNPQYAQYPQYGEYSEEDGENTQNRLHPIKQYTTHKWKGTNMLSHSQIPSITNTHSHIQDPSRTQTQTQINFYPQHSQFSQTMYSNQNHSPASQWPSQAHGLPQQSKSKGKSQSKSHIYPRKKRMLSGDAAILTSKDFKINPIVNADLYQKRLGKTFHQFKNNFATVFNDRAISNRIFVL
jgi:hypothetical protein